MHKKKELQAILNMTLRSPKEEGYGFDPEETGSTFHENAILKAKELQKLLGKEEPVIADDSGLCLDALGGKPGVLTAVYGMENGNKLTSYQQNIQLLEELGDNPVRTARFVCTMVLLLSNERFFIVQETLEGEIVKKSEMRGDGGFGYDPIFLIPQFGRTLAELSADEKNSISHRGKAGKLISEFLNEI